MNKRNWVTRLTNNVCIAITINNDFLRFHTLYNNVNSLLNYEITYYNYKITEREKM